MIFENDLVSVIMPCYNSQNYIEYAIESVLNQTYSNLELIIVDDFSSDNSFEIINYKALTDARVRIFKNNCNYGVAFSRNFALEKSHGRYVAFLDSDDIWCANKLEIQLNFLKKYKYAFCFTAYDLISNDGNKLNKFISVPNFVNYNQLLKNSIIGCLTVLIDRSTIENVYFPNFKTSQDLACWLNILKDGKTAFGLNIILASYRLSKTSATKNKFKAVYGVFVIYRKFLKLTFINSVWNLMFYMYNAIKKRF